MAILAGCGSPPQHPSVQLSGEWRAVYEDSKETFEAARRLPPESEERIVQLAEARREVERVLRAVPENFSAARLLQDIWLESDPEHAATLYLEASAETAADWTLQARMVPEEDRREARKMLEQALVADPEYPWAHFGMACIDTDLDNPRSALEHLEQALEMSPGLVEALRLQSYLLDEEGRRDLALESYQKLLAVEPSDLRARSQYASLLLESDLEADARDAEKELRRVLAELRRAPREQGVPGLLGDTYLDLGSALMLQSRPEPALEAFDQAIETNPNCLDAYYNIGRVCYRSLERPQAALEAFEQYLERADAWEGALPYRYLFDRYVHVPNYIAELRAQLDQ